MRIRSVLIASLAMLLIAPAALPGETAPEVTEEVVVGLRWGASASDVETAFPGGEWKPRQNVQFYTVANDRPFLGTPRTQGDEIVFLVNPVRGLSSVTFEFAPTEEMFQALSARLEERYGPLQRFTSGPARIRGTSEDRVPRLALVLFDDGKERELRLPAVITPARKP